MEFANLARVLAGSACKVHFDLPEGATPYAQTTGIHVPESWKRAQIRREDSENVLTTLFHEFQHVRHSRRFMQNYDTRVYRSKISVLPQGTRTFPSAMYMDAMNVLLDVRDDALGFARHKGMPSVYEGAYNSLFDTFAKEPVWNELTASRRLHLVFVLSITDDKYQDYRDHKLFSRMQEVEEKFPEALAIARDPEIRKIVLRFKNATKKECDEFFQEKGRTNLQFEAYDYAKLVWDAVTSDLGDEEQEEPQPEPSGRPAPAEDQDEQEDDGQEENQEPEPQPDSEDESEDTEGINDDEPTEDDEEWREGNSTDEEESDEDEEEDGDGDGDGDEGDDEEDEDGDESGEGDDDEEESDEEDGMQSDGGRNPDGAGGNSGDDEEELTDAEIEELANNAPTKGELEMEYSSEDSFIEDSFEKLQAIAESGFRKIDKLSLKEAIKKIFFTHRSFDEHANLNPANLWSVKADPELLFESERIEHKAEQWTIAIIGDNSGSMTYNMSIDQETGQRISVGDIQVGMMSDLQDAIEQLNEEEGLEHQVIIGHFEGRGYTTERLAWADDDQRKEREDNLVEECIDKGIRDESSKDWTGKFDFSGGTFPAMGLCALNVYLQREKGSYDPEKLLVLLLTDGELDNLDYSELLREVECLPDGSTYQFIELCKDSSRFKSKLVPQAWKLPSVVEEIAHEAKQLR